MTKLKGIIAYGTEEDREKLAALALMYDMTGSQLLLHFIRERYQEVYGQTDPKRFITGKQK